MTFTLCSNGLKHPHVLYTRREHFPPLFFQQLRSFSAVLGEIVGNPITEIAHELYFNQALINYTIRDFKSLTLLPITTLKRKSAA